MIKFIIVGKQASGKTKLLKGFENKGLKVLKSHTDRPKRNKEDNDYIFHKKIVGFPKNSILKTTLGDYKYYTTPKDINNSDVMILDPKGAIEVIKKYKNIDFIVIYVNPNENIRKDKLKERLNRDYIIDRENIEKYTFKGFDNMLKTKEMYEDIWLPNMALINIFENSYDEKEIKSFVDLSLRQRDFMNSLSKIIKRAYKKSLFTRGKENNTILATYSDGIVKDRTYTAVAGEFMLKPEQLRSLIEVCLKNNIIS